MLLLFSDIDGTIIDDNFRFNLSSESIEKLKALNIPLIPVSAKTFHEIVEFEKEIGIFTPFSFENGAGVAFPSDSPSEKERYLFETSGYKIDTLKLKFSELNCLFSNTLVSLHDMPTLEASKISGLDENQILLSKKRTGSLPFIATENPEEIDSETINFFLVKNSLKIEKGKKFSYLMSSESSKGASIKKILKYYKINNPDKNITTISIGDAFNDLSMFEAVDRAFCVNSSLREFVSMPWLSFTFHSGPAGFNEAVSQILKEDFLYA